MNYWKIVHFLHNVTNQPFKFRTKNWTEINEVACGTNNKNIQIKFKTWIQIQYEGQVY